MTLQTAARRQSGSCRSIPLDNPATALCPRCRAHLDDLYRKESARLLAYLSRQVGCESADDLAQEVFLRAAHSPQLTRLKNPGGFLHRIARNLLIDRARRRRCGATTIPLCDTVETATDPLQEADLQVNEAEAIYERTLAGFPERTALIFAMSRVERKTYREISDALAISQAAVEYHMMRALARLRADFGQA